MTFRPWVTASSPRLVYRVTTGTPCLNAPCALSNHSHLTKYKNIKTEYYAVNHTKQTQRELLKRVTRLKLIKYEILLHSSKFLLHQFYERGEEPSIICKLKLERRFQAPQQSA